MQVPGQPGFGTELFNCAIQARLVDQVVLLEPFEPLLPQLAVERLLLACSLFRNVDLKVEIKPLAKFLGKGVGRGE